MKHRNLRRAAGLLLAAALVIGTLCGCGGKGSGETTDGGGEGTGSGGSQGNQTQEAGGQAMGRFLEEAVDTGICFANIYDMQKLEDGSIRLIGEDGDTEKDGVWESKDDGKTWNKVFDFPAEVLTNHDKGYVNHAALSPGGQIVCAFNEIVGSGVHQALYLLDKEGKASKIPFEVPKAEDDQTDDFAISNLISNLQFPSDEWVLLADSALETVYQVSVPDGSLKHTYETDMGLGPMPMHSAGNTLILQDESQALLYDLQTGERKDSEEALNKGSNENGRFSVVDTMDRGESIYSISPGGLCRYKFGGSVMERLIDGSMNSLGSPTFYPIALTMLDEQNFLVAAEDANANPETGIALLRYTYSADTLAKPDKELKVYSLYDNKEIRQSVIQFQKEHTDVYVNYEAGLAEDSGMMVSDTLKTLTTEIMAGNGPDVLMLDGMPVETYIEKGILKDLSALLKESGGSYFENITSAYQDGQGQVCAVPARFKIPMIQAEGAYYTQDEDFDAFTARKDTMVNMYPKTVVEKFWFTCGAAWRKDDKTLDEAKITEFLTKLKNAYGEYDSSLDEESTLEYSSTTNNEVVSKLSMGSGDFDLAFGRCHTNFGLRESMDYGMQNEVNKKLEDGIIGLMPGQADRVFVPSMIFGISNKAAQPEAANEFIKYVFSKEAQKLSQSGGFPVEKEAFRNAIDGHVYEGKDVSFAVGGPRGEIIEYDREPTPEKEIAKMTEIAESLITPAFQDDVIKDAVIEQGAKVLKGEISPEEATAAIIKKVNIYLAE